MSSGRVTAANGLPPAEIEAAADLNALGDGVEQSTTAEVHPSLRYLRLAGRLGAGRVGGSVMVSPVGLARARSYV